MMMRRIALIPILAAICVCRAFSGDDDSGLAEKAKSVFDFQSFLRGDIDAGVEFALLRVQDLQDTPLAELLMRLVLVQNPDQFSSVDIGEADARRLLSAEPALPPELVDLARRYVARAMTFSGRREEALQIHLQRGMATFWSVAGPFSSFNPPGVGVQTLPEAEAIPRDVSPDNPPDADDYRRWSRNPPWRAVPQSQSAPFAYPWRWLGRQGDGAVLMKTALHVEEADPRAVMHVRSDASWTLFIDGAATAAVDKDRTEVPREHTVEFPLSAGWHSVVLLLAPPLDGTGVMEAGVAVRLISSSPFSWAAESPTEPPSNPPMRLRDARRPRYMAELAAAANQDPVLRAAYAVACFEQGMKDEAAWHASIAARANPENINLLILAGAYTLADPFLPPLRREDMAAAWYRRALSARDDLVPALLFFARRAAAEGRESEAWGYLERAYASNPKSLSVLLARARWASVFAPATTSRQMWEECAKAYPQCAAAWREFAALPSGEYWDLERRVEVCRAAAAAGGDKPVSAMLLGDALAGSGDVQATAAAVREVLAAFPDDLSALVWAADVYARVSLYEDAVRCVRDALRLTPDSPTLWRRLGDLSRETGKRDDATTYWRASLAGDPGQYDLLEMLRALAGDKGQSYFDGGYDAEAMVREADPAAHSGDVVRLLDRSVVVIRRDGSYRRLTHEIDLALTRRGGDMLADIRPRGELLTARTIFPTGDTLELELFPGRSGLRLPALLPGAARELQFLETAPVRGDIPAPISAWYFQDPKGRTPLLVSEYVVRTPRHFPLIYTLRDFGHPVEFEKTVEGEEDVYRWTARLGLSPDEPDAVHVSERLPFVEVGTAISWNEISQRTLRRLSGRLMPARGMMALLSSLRVRQGDVVDHENTARAIYRFVCDNIDSSPGGDSASWILADRMGDRNILLLSMLRAAGFDAHPAAARPRRALLRPPNWELPGPEIFTIPLVRLTLPGADSPLWLDCRFQTLPFGAMPDDLSDASVITYLPDGPVFSSMPVLPAAESASIEERRILLPAGADDEARIIGRSQYKGTVGLARRQFMAGADSAARRQSVLDALFPVFPDARLMQIDIQQADPVDSEAQERYEIESSLVIEERPGGILAAPLCLAPPNLVSPESRNLTTRRTVCHIDSERILEDRNSFILPAGPVFTRIPSSADIPSRFGTYQLRIVQRGSRQLDVIRNYRFPAMRIEPWEWGDFLAFLDRIDLAERQWIEYGKPQGDRDR